MPRLRFSSHPPCLVGSTKAHPGASASSITQTLAASYRRLSGLEKTPWLLKQKPKLSSAELRIDNSYFGGDTEDDAQSILDILPSLHHLTIQWQQYRDKVPAVPSLSVHRELRALDVQLRVGGKIMWNACAEWLRDLVNTITSERLTTLVLNIVITVDTLLVACCPHPDEASEDPVFSQHGPGTRWTQTLEKVDARIVVILVESRVLSASSARHWRLGKHANTVFPISSLSVNRKGFCGSRPRQMHDYL
ncbi:hypothetical protein C8R44DRAFT_872514 [Mycena epipterygia]|nr:hypothetical protein C8R44DRAFT_872514 [Mycena epipterygia]